MIPFRVKKLTKTAKEPHRNCESDLWDLYADDFVFWQAKEEKCLTNNLIFDSDKKMKGAELKPQGRILVKTGISLELPKYYSYPKSIDFPDEKTNRDKSELCWVYDDDLMLNRYKEFHHCSDALEQRGLFIENKIITGGEVSFVAINNGHEPITISKGDVIAKMLIRPLYPSKMEIVEHIEDTGRGGYGSTGK